VQGTSRGVLCTQIFFIGEGIYKKKLTQNHLPSLLTPIFSFNNECIQILIFKIFKLLKDYDFRFLNFFRTT